MEVAEYENDRRAIEHITNANVLSIRVGERAF
jgi:hypothetical protein